MICASLITKLIFVLFDLDRIQEEFWLLFFAIDSSKRRPECCQLAFILTFIPFKLLQVPVVLPIPPGIVVAIQEHSIFRLG